MATINEQSLISSNTLELESNNIEISAQKMDSEISTNGLETTKSNRIPIQIPNEDINHIMKDQNDLEDLSHGTIVSINYEFGPMYLDLSSREDGTGAFVKSFRRKPNGELSNAEKDGRIHEKDMLLAINDIIVAELPFVDIVQLAKAATYPLSLTFHCYNQSIEKKDLNLKDEEAQDQEGSEHTRRGSFTDQLPSSISAWSSKLGRMLSESGRSSSLSGLPSNTMSSSSIASPTGSQTSLTSTNAKVIDVQTSPSNMNTKETSASIYSPATPTKKRQWGDLTNTDGMKNILRILNGSGNFSLNQNGKLGGEVDKKGEKMLIQHWINDLVLVIEKDSSIDATKTQENVVTENTCYHSCNIMTLLGSTGHKLGSGSRDGILKELKFIWYRKSNVINEESIEESKVTNHESKVSRIYGADSCQYHPSIDDIESSIYLQIQSVRFSEVMKVLELTTCIKIDPTVDEMVNLLVKMGSGSFSAVLATNEHDSFQIKIDTKGVTLIKISENEDETGVLAMASYNKDLQVVIDASDLNSLRFLLKFQACGDVIGSRPGEKCDFKAHTAAKTKACGYMLIAPNREHRDILAHVIRSFRALSLSSADEKNAREEELTFFSTPTTCLQTANRTDISEQNFGKDSMLDSPPLTQQISTLMTGNGKLSSLFPFMLSDINNFPASGNPSVPSTTKVVNPDSIEKLDFLPQQLISQANEIDCLKRKINSLSAHITTLVEENTLLMNNAGLKEDRIETLTNKVMEWEEKYNLQDQLKIDFSNKIDPIEHEKVKSELEKEKQAYGNLQSKFQKLTLENEKLKHQLEDKNSNVKEVDETSVVKYMESHIDKLSLELDSQLQRTSELEKNIVLLTSERNALASQKASLSHELKRIVGSHRTLEEVQSQLKERDDLAMQLAVAKAEKKRAMDEMKEYEEALEHVMKQQGMKGGEKDKILATQRILSENLELQRRVNQLSESLNEAKNQVATTKAINSALVNRRVSNPTSPIRAGILSGGESGESDGSGEDDDESDVDDPVFTDDDG